MEKHEPIHEIELRGIRAEIRQRQTKDNEPWFSTKLCRLYQDEDDRKEIFSFRRDDLPVAVKVMDMAYAWILRHEQKLEQAAASSNGTNPRAVFRRA